MATMMARLWRGKAKDAANGDAYQRHVTRNVIPELKKIAGHEGAVLSEFDERVSHYEVMQ